MTHYSFPTNTNRHFSKQQFSYLPEKVYKMKKKTKKMCCHEKLKLTSLGMEKEAGTKEAACRAIGTLFVFTNYNVPLDKLS